VIDREMPHSIPSKSAATREAPSLKAWAQERRKTNWLFAIASSNGANGSLRLAGVVSGRSARTEG
jgi:hypothetical protein